MIYINFFVHPPPKKKGRKTQKKKEIKTINTNRKIKSNALDNLMGQKQKNTKEHKCHLELYRHQAQATR